MVSGLNDTAKNALKSLFGKGYASVGAQSQAYQQLVIDCQNSPFLATSINFFVDRGGIFQLGGAGGGTRTLSSHAILVDASYIDQFNTGSISAYLVASFIAHELGHALLKFGIEGGTRNVSSAVVQGELAEGSAFLSEAITVAQLGRSNTWSDSDPSHLNLEKVQADIKTTLGTNDLSLLDLQGVINSPLSVSVQSTAILDGGHAFDGRQVSGLSDEWTYLDKWKATTAVNTVSAEYGDTIPIPLQISEYGAEYGECRIRRHDTYSPANLRIRRRIRRHDTYSLQISPAVPSDSRGAVRAAACVSDGGSRAAGTGARSSGAPL